MSITHAAVAGPLVEIADYQANHLIGNGTITAAQIASGVVPPLGSATPLVESGSGAAGTATNSSHEDHVHPAASGGSTNAPDGKPYNFSPAASPKTIDDEFSDLTASQSGPVNGLNAKWTKHNLGTSSWWALSDSKAPGSFLFTLPSGQTADQAIYQATPAGDFTIQCRLSAVWGAAGGRSMWAMFALDTSGNGCSASFDLNGSSSQVGYRDVTNWQQSGTFVDVGFSVGVYALLAGAPVTMTLRKASGVYFVSATLGDRVLAPGNIEVSHTPTAFTNAYVGIGRIYDSGTAISSVAYDYLRQTA